MVSSDQITFFNLTGIPHMSFGDLKCHMKLWLVKNTDGLICEDGLIQGDLHKSISFLCDGVNWTLGDVQDYKHFCIHPDLNLKVT